MKFYFAISLVLSITLLVSRTSAAENRVVFELTPTKENPRNSEGDFIPLKNGRILFIYTQFYGGRGDHSPARIVSVESEDGGVTWTQQPKVVVENVGKQNVMSVSLLRLKSGKIALFYLVKNGDHDCRPIVQFSEDEAQTWSEPSGITSAVNYFVVNNDRVIQLKNGRILMPLALHKLRTLPGMKTAFDSRAIAVWYWSDDEGKNWREADDWWALNASTRTGMQEPGVVELGDGRIWSWARTDQRFQFACLSTNAGQNWSAPLPTTLRSPASPASIEKLPGSSDLLAVYNDVSGSTPETEKFRTPLVTAISRDNGQTWNSRKVLEDDPNGWYCYTAIEYVDDAVLLAYCAGDRTDKIGGGLGRLRIRRVGLDWLTK